jgi:hypothetical protein
MGHVERMGEYRKAYKVLGWKSRSIEATRKTEAYMEGWDQNGSYEHRLDEFRVDSVGSGSRPVAGSNEYGDESSDSGATYLRRGYSYEEMCGPTN